GRILAAVYRVAIPTLAGSRQGLALRLMIDPKRAAAPTAQTLARASPWSLSVPGPWGPGPGPVSVLGLRSRLGPESFVRVLRPGPSSKSLVPNITHSLQPLVLPER